MFLVLLLLLLPLPLPLSDLCTTDNATLKALTKARSSRIPGHREKCSFRAEESQEGPTLR